MFNLGLMLLMTGGFGALLVVFGSQEDKIAAIMEQLEDKDNK